MSKRTVTSAERKEGLSPLQLETRNLAKKANRIRKKLEETGENFKYLSEAKNFLSSEGRKSFKEDYKTATDSEATKYKREIEKFLKKHEQYLHKSTNQRQKEKPKTTAKTQRQKNRDEIGELAKKANRKLKNLEDSGLLERAENSPAYRKAISYIQTRGGNFRFPYGYLTMDSEEARGYKREIEAFLEAKSSTPSGTLNTINKRERTLDAKFGINNEEKRQAFYKFVGSRLFKRLSGLLDSNQAVNLFINGAVEHESFSWDMLTMDDLGLMTNEQKEMMNELMNERYGVTPFEITQPKMRRKDGDVSLRDLFKRKK